jgi:gliding motility-associated-like protein
MIQFENGSTTALQSSNTFVNIPGFHELIVENKDGCGLVKEVLQYYKQQHSLRQMETALMIMELKGLNGSIYKNAKIFIFDRYGKLKQLNPYGVGWDGIITKFPSSDDYWCIQYNLKTVEKQRPF